MSISIRVNGDARQVEEGLTVAALLDALGVKAQRVVVEHNMRILHGEDFAQARIADGDELEVLQFVGGG
ncbi:MAG TPA: sulfur carrier protein ThiS [Candidatus Dormibacteraeota bacterium]|nr:sulfur carrier protein ThiS [Candidatus Dormibacteraeota bacterium]